MQDPHTTAIHGDSGVPDGPDLGPPIHVTSTYDRSNQSDLTYRRDEHQTTARLEAVVGALEGGSAIAYPSGMAASASLLRYLRPRSIALPADVYHGTRRLVTLDPSIEVVSPEHLADGDVWWLESPSNPRCRVADIAATAAGAVATGVTVVVDSTFATPVLQQPIALGADFVVHSTTKFISGHSDAMGGVVVSQAFAHGDGLRMARAVDGSIPGSLDVWLTLRGVRTLPLRVERQSATALEVATYLETVVPVVWYPFLATHPDHAVAVSQMAAGGGVLSFEVDDEAEAKEVVAAMRIFRMATSLGGVESTVEHRRSVNPSAPPGLVRLSIGLESPAVLISDLAQAINR